MEEDTESKLFGQKVGIGVLQSHEAFQAANLYCSS